MTLPSDRLLASLRHRRTLRGLAHLDDRLLADIGFTDADKAQVRTHRSPSPSSPPLDAPAKPPCTSL